jgi:MraZ protein
MASGGDGQTAMFLSKFDNKVDKKGRVSVPAAWRALLSAQSFNGIVVYPSPKSLAIEGCGMDRMELLSDSIDTLNPFSDQHDAFATSILSASFPLQFDAEGRVLLPEQILSHGGISDIATFSGRGKTFQIWNPERFEEYRLQAFETARQEAPDLRLRSNANSSGNGPSIGPGIGPGGDGNGGAA